MSKKEDKNFIEKVIDTTTNATVKSGQAAARAFTLMNADVPAEAIAIIMSNRSSNNYTYTTEDVNTLVKLYKDSLTDTVLTKKQTAALLKDQHSLNNHGKIK